MLLKALVLERLGWKTSLLWEVGRARHVLTSGVWETRLLMETKAVGVRAVRRPCVLPVPCRLPV